jgi:hypothetical protein
LPKVVVIKDRRLGLLNLFFNLCILLYVLFYLILYQNGSILYLPATGGVTMQILAPTLHTVLNGSHSDSTIPCCKDLACARKFHDLGLKNPPIVSEHCIGPPCDPATPNCLRYFEGLQDLKYCTQSGKRSREQSKWGRSSRVPNLNCTYWDAPDAVYATTDGYLLTTRTTISEQVRHNSPEVAWTKKARARLAAKEAALEEELTNGRRLKGTTDANARGGDNNTAEESPAEESPHELTNCGCSSMTDPQSCSMKHPSLNRTNDGYGCPKMWRAPGAVGGGGVGVGEEEDGGDAVHEW